MADHVFICYARSDQEFVLQLAKNLKDRGVSVWLDQWDVLPGADWDQSIDEALYECAQMLIVLSPTSIQSREVRGELRIALDEHKPIVPVLFKKCFIPRQLRVVHYVDFTSVQPDDSVALSSILRVLNVQKDSEESRRKELEEQQAKREAKKKRKLKETEEEQSPFDKLEAELDEISFAVVDEETKRSKSTPETFTNDIGMKFVLIPAGNFKMGSEKYEDEQPQHEVTISQEFYLQTTQVTQGQWQKVMGANPSEFNDCGDNCPVETVSWIDTQEFIKKLNKMEGADNYRLPTEAEWEYAVRAGSTTEFFFGDDEDRLDEYAWYNKNSDSKTHPVGQKEPNAYGLYDMTGNVYEWVEDDYHDNYKGAPRDGKAWIDNPRGSGRVMRGGCWSFDARRCRSADRGNYSPGGRLLIVGFRLSRSVALGP